MNKVKFRVENDVLGKKECVFHNQWVKYIIYVKIPRGDRMPLSRSPNSKSNPTDDWVFIRIGFFNHPAIRESFKEARYSNITKTKVVSLHKEVMKHVLE